MLKYEIFLFHFLAISVISNNCFDLTLHKTKHNQRTIGHVHAHLISEPIISTKPGYKWHYCIFQVFIVRYPEMHKVQGAYCSISKLMYGSCVCTDDNHSLNLIVAYRFVHTDEPYINLH